MPASGARVNAGAEVAVQSTAMDAQGIARVELWVDGAVVRSNALPAPQAAYTVIQRWIAMTPGAHVIQVKAYNTAGAASDPAIVSIEVVGAPTTAGGLVPATAIPPGQSPAGATAIPTVPSPNPTVAKQPPAQPACPGAPAIASFSANPTTITAGQTTTLSWGAVTNATSATIDQGIGGVVTPNSLVVKPDKTTTYTLTATGCGGTVTKQAIVTVSPASAKASCSGSPNIANFGATPAEITEGQSSTLNWTVANASKVEISQGIGEVAATGTRTVSPKITTSYVLTVTGCDGTGLIAQIIVTVKSASPVVHSSKDLEIKQTWAADLDEGILGARHIADIDFHALTATEMYLEAANGAQLSFIGASDGNPARCQGKLTVTNKIPINDLVARTYVCYTTNQGRPGMFRVKSVGAEIATGAKVIVIAYTTWEK